MPARPENIELIFANTGPHPEVNGSTPNSIDPANRPLPTSPAPPTTTTMKMGRPFSRLNRAGATDPSCIAYRAPPRPAMPAEKANTPIRGHSRFNPNVAQAASLSRMATSCRPNRLHRNAATRRATNAKATAESIMSDPGVSKSRPNRRTGSTLTDPTSKMLMCTGPMSKSGRLNSHRSSATANAAVASAR